MAEQCSAFNSLSNPLSVVMLNQAETDTARLVYAVLSGALASGMGYAIWYKALPHLTANSAGISQLTVPVIAAIGGVILLGETLSLKFGIVSLLILGGVAIATLKPR